jgi:hypothetical protein
VEERKFASKLIYEPLKKTFMGFFEKVAKGFSIQVRFIHLIILNLHIFFLSQSRYFPKPTREKTPYMYTTIICGAL